MPRLGAKLLYIDFGWKIEFPKCQEHLIVTAEAFIISHGLSFKLFDFVSGHWEIYNPLFGNMIAGLPRFACIISVKHQQISKFSWQASFNIEPDPLSLIMPPSLLEMDAGLLPPTFHSPYSPFLPFSNICNDIETLRFSDLWIGLWKVLYYPSVDWDASLSLSSKALMWGWAVQSGTTLFRAVDWGPSGRSHGGYWLKRRISLLISTSETQAVIQGSDTRQVREHLFSSKRFTVTFCYRTPHVNFQFQASKRQLMLVKMKLAYAGVIFPSLY